MGTGDLSCKLSCLDVYTPWKPFVFTSSTLHFYKLTIQRLRTLRDIEINGSEIATKLHEFSLIVGLSQ